jgi:hypothetical protein
MPPQITKTFPFMPRQYNRPALNEDADETEDSTDEGWRDGAHEIAAVRYGVEATAWRLDPAHGGGVRVELADHAGRRVVEVTRDAVLEVDFGGMGAAVGMCPVYALLHERGHSASVGLDIDTDRDPDISGPVLSPEDLRDHLNRLLAVVAEEVDCHFVRVRPDGDAHVEVRTHEGFAYAVSPTATRLATVAPGEGERVHLWNPVTAGWQGRLDVPGACALAFVGDHELCVGCDDGQVVRLRYGRSQTWTERARVHDPEHAVFAPRLAEARSSDGRWLVRATSRSVRSYLVG